MSLIRKIKIRLHGSNHSYVDILSQQTFFLSQTSSYLVEMLGGIDESLWKQREKEIKSCEAQGDALLTEFHEQLSGSIFVPVNKLDLQAVAMTMDDCLDVIKDSAKSILIYKPETLDPQLKELAQMAKDQSEALCKMIPLLSDIRKNITAIQLSCDRVTELEHLADEAYEEYIGWIFENVSDVRELVKYKSLSEMLENATDAFKRISDNVRKLLLNYLSA